MKTETERLKLRQKYRDEVNPVLSEKRLPKDTHTFTDDYVFWLEEKLVKNIEVIHCCMGEAEQLKPKQQICYKRNEPCKYDCSGLCKESC